MIYRATGILFFLAGFFNSNAQNFYDINTIQKIEIQFSQTDWDYQLDLLKYTSDKYLMADWVKINGLKYDSVGVKYKGNSSYDSTFKKNPIHIELNTYKDQDFQGYVDIKLGNSYSDPSMIREVLAYNILKNYMDCPNANFAIVYINGKYFGIYSNAESINKRFCNSRFYSDNNVFMKGNPNLTPGPTVKSNLKYLGKDSFLYKDFYEKKSKNGWNDFVNLCDTITNYPGRIGNIMDMDRAIWMLAFNNLLINLDSYSGAFAQNYYLYKDNTGRYNPIVWDLNMAFGGFPFAGSPNNGMGTLSIANMQQFIPFYHDTHTDWPLINAVMSNATYKKMYVAHIRTIIKDYFSNNQYVALATQFQNLIDTSLQSDSTKFFRYSQFKNAMNTNVNIGSYSVPGISTLMEARSIYLKSTTDFTQTPPVISSITANPTVPAYNAPVNFVASVTNTKMDVVFFNYKFDETKKFEKLQMLDDGKHGDGNANDNVYGVLLTMTAASMKYYIYAENANAGMFSPERAEHEFHTLEIPTDTIKKVDLVINEFLAINDKSDINEYGIYSDWIELYNNTNRTLNLTGYYLSNDVSSLKKYAFDVNTTIAPNAYLMLWADDLKTTAKYTHCGFTLSGGNGQVVLSNPKGAIIDSINYTQQYEDVSRGRCPNGTGKFTGIETPTFKESNNFFCLSGIKEAKAIINTVLVYPNPANNFVTFESQSFNIYSVELYNRWGELLKKVSFQNKKVTLNLDGLSSNNYYYVIKDKKGRMIGKGVLTVLK